MQTWYRYDEVHYAPPLDEYDYPCGEGRVDLRLTSFNVEKITPKGVRLDNGRFVLLNARKRYACPTKEEALESFVARKNRQRKILKAQLNSVDKALALVSSEKQRLIQSVGRSIRHDEKVTPYITFLDDELHA